MDDPNWLANVVDIAAGLKLSGANVVLGYASHQLLIAGAVKVDAIASGTWLNVRLATLGLPAIASCRAGVTREQAVKIGRLVREYADGKATVWGDCTEAGEAAMKAMLGYLSQECFVRVAWTTKSHGGDFAGRTLDQLTAEEIAAVTPDRQ